jgi:hypothetical protein
MMFTLDDRTADPQDVMVACAIAIKGCGWWSLLGEDERWPLATADVCRLLTAAGFDTEALPDLIDRGIIPAPAAENEWNAHDVMRAADQLEFRRAWLPNSQHDQKKADVELALDHARARGEVGAICGSTGPRYDLRHLIELLVRSDVHEGRRKIAVLLRAVLEHEHNIRT